MDNPEFVDLTHGQKHKLPSNIEHCVSFKNEQILKIIQNSY